VKVRRILPFLLAALLGVGAAVLAACGSAGDRGIPAASASDLKRQIQDVREAVDGKRCQDVSGQLRQVDEGIDDLPPTVDEQLRTNLRDGANKLLTAARDECDATPTKTATTTTETLPEETTTDTLPTETQTTPPPTTTTTAPAPPTTTAPQPPPEPPPPAPAPVPPPPSGTPGGGVEPQIP
jgi:outer membrane biosynthesis protein TonB